MPRRVLPIAAVLAAGALLASACSIADHAAGAGAHDHHHLAPPSTRVPAAAPRRPGPARATAAPVRVVMNDRFRYQPTSIVVRAGRRVTFAVHNAGRLPHEFILGDRATQLDHERQMQAAPPGTGHGDAHAHMHDMAAAPSGAGALTVPPGQTRRLTWTFDRPGIVLYGCHVLGHWAAGMKGTIVIMSLDRPPQRY